LTQWRIALRMARNRPLLGVGPDNFRWVYGDFAGLTTWDTGSHANSVYFEWLADTGLVALGVFVWLSWRLLRRSFSDLELFHRQLSSIWVWRVGLAASLTAWFLHGFFDYFYEPLPTNLAFWLVAGLALAAAEPAWRTGQNVAECESPST
jgi:O-antigen ligase